MCVRVGRVRVHAYGLGDVHLAGHESGVVQPSAVISLIIFNGRSFMLGAAAWRTAPCRCHLIPSVVGLVCSRQ